MELADKNQDVATVYMMTRGQWITAGMGQVVDVSIPAIKIVMDLYEVKDQKECLDRVLRCFHHFKPKAKEGGEG